MYAEAVDLYCAAVGMVATPVDGSTCMSQGGVQTDDRAIIDQVNQPSEPDGSAGFISEEPQLPVHEVEGLQTEKLVSICWFHFSATPAIRQAVTKDPKLLLFRQDGRPSPVYLILSRDKRFNLPHINCCNSFGVIPRFDFWMTFRVKAMKDAPSSLKFMNLPAEIRNKIYQHLLAPAYCKFNDTHDEAILRLFASDYSSDRQTYFDPWRNGLGCTKVLGLSRTIYEEARKFLPLSPVLDLTGRTTKIFRHALMHGTPRMFRECGRNSWMWVPPQRHTELSFLGQYTVTVKLAYEAGQMLSNNLKAQIQALKSCIAQSIKIKNLQLLIQTDRLDKLARKRYDDYVREDNPDCLDYNGSQHVPYVRGISTELLRHVLQIVFIAGARGIEATVQTGKDFEHRVREDCDYVIIRTKILHYPAYEDPNVLLYDEILRNGKEAAAAYDILLDEYFVSSSQTNSRASSVSTFDKYILTPECRYHRCRRVFGGSAELRAHLLDKPGHDVPFKKERYNELSPTASTSYFKYKCTECALPLDKQTHMSNHCWRKGHHRDPRDDGIVPRYTRDNNWFFTLQHSQLKAKKAVMGKSRSDDMENADRY